MHPVAEDIFVAIYIMRLIKLIKLMPFMCCLFFLKFNCCKPNLFKTGVLFWDIPHYSGEPLRQLLPYMKSRCIYYANILNMCDRLPNNCGDKLTDKSNFLLFLARRQHVFSNKYAIQLKTKSLLLHLT